ncbi:MAG: hypothetical protein R3E76_07025 [Planctomycetota bacterium]
MGKVRRIVMAWVLVTAGFALMGAMGYIAHAESGPGTWFGGADGQMGNAPRKRPSGNRAWSGNQPRDEGDDSEVPPERDVRKPIPEDESIWEDVPETELTNGERLKSRPGNFEALATLLEFVEGTVRVEPKFLNLAFPFRQERVILSSKDDEEPETRVEIEVVASEEDFKARFGEIEARTRKRGKKRQNSTRKRNLFIERLEVLDFAPEEAELVGADDFGLTEDQVAAFGDLRKDHPEQCCLVKLTMRMESLDSDRTSTDDSVFCLVRKPNGWKICWIAAIRE